MGNRVLLQTQDNELFKKNRVNKNMHTFNCLVACDKTGGIGNTKSADPTHTLPWKLSNEFKYYQEMCYHDKDKFVAEGKKTLLICGPKVFEEASQLHPEPFYWAVVSRSIKEKPKLCDILSADYSLKEMVDL